MYTNQAEEPASPVYLKFNVWHFSIDKNYLWSRILDAINSIYDCIFTHHNVSSKKVIAVLLLAGNNKLENYTAAMQ